MPCQQNGFLKTYWLKNNSSIALYLSSTIGNWAAVSPEEFIPLMTTLYQKYGQNSLFQDALLSGADGIEEKLITQLKQLSFENKEEVISKLAIVVDNRHHDRPNSIFEKQNLIEGGRTAGAKLFRKICAACHSAGGEGIADLAPPLMNSEYVSAPLERLGLIILHGLEGPVHVNGTLYELGHAMPGLTNDKNLSDKDISDIISYVTNAFSNTPKGLKTAKIKELRAEKSKSGMEYTEEELLTRIN